jgi:uncharacterized protein YsxB (DUF464 family)
MSQGFDAVCSSLEFLDVVALKVFPTVVQSMPATNRNTEEQMIRAAAAAYDLAEKLLLERQRRHAEFLGLPPKGR